MTYYHSKMIIVGLHVIMFHLLIYSLLARNILASLFPNILWQYASKSMLVFSRWYAHNEALILVSSFIQVINSFLLLTPGSWSLELSAVLERLEMSSYSSDARDGESHWVKLSKGWWGVFHKLLDPSTQFHPTPLIHTWAVSYCTPHGRFSACLLSIPYFTPKLRAFVLRKCPPKASGIERGATNPDRMREDFPEKGTTKISIEVWLEVDGRACQNKFLKMDRERIYHSLI